MGHVKNGFEEYPVEKEGMMDKRCSRMQAWGYWYGGCRLVRENGYEGMRTDQWA